MEAKLAHVVELSSDTHTRQDFIIIPRLFFSSGEDDWRWC